VRIPDGFELTKRAHQLLAEHLRKQRAARLAVAVLTGERPAVANYQVGCAIEVHSHGDAAVTKMSVESGLILILVQQRTEIAQIGTELLRRNRRIVPPLPFKRSAWSC